MTNLRVGNLVTARGSNFVVEVDQLFLEDIKNKTVFYSGIEITPTWLENFGFSCYCSNYYTIVAERDRERSVFCLSFNCGKWYYLEQQIKYIHVLQNLYFDLFNKPIKL